MVNNNLKPISSSDIVIASGTTKISAQLLDPTHIAVSYGTLMGNQPKNFGNVVSVWSGSEIGWSNKPNPIVTVPVPGTTPDGDMVVPLGSQPPSPPYVVAYGTSNSGTAYCAAQIVPSDPPPDPITTQISLPWVGTDSLLAGFITPPQNCPRAYGNWIGLWQGQGITYNGINRIAKVNIDGNVATGSQSMNDLSLTFDTVYTLGYACGPRDQDLAAWLTFKTQPFLRQLLRSLLRMFRQRT